MARSPCLYCGAALPATLVAAAAEISRPAAPRLGAPVAGEPASTSERLLLILDLTSTDRETLARALGIGPFEADQRLRRGGFELLRIGEAGVITGEAARLAAEGLRVSTVPAPEARLRPRLALGGTCEASVLELETGEGPVRVEASDLVLVVRGPIAREYESSHRARAIGANIILGALDISITERRQSDGYRIHFHRRSDPRPLEADPAAFDFRRPVLARSALLEILSWIEEIAPGLPSDDGFRRLPPALGPAAPETGVLAAPLGRGAAPGGRNEAALDNLEQFRFYSAWRAAFERRRARP